MAAIHLLTSTAAARDFEAEVITSRMLLFL